MPPVEIRLIVNSRPHALSTEPCRTLLSLLREELGLLSVKEGCGQGDCGACVVVMDGQAVNSCLVLAAQADGAEIITLEGLAEEGRLHPLQRRFMEHWAFQCGFCTPGMILSCYALLLTHPQPAPDEVRQAVAGNLCRCTSYHNIVAAVEAAAADLASPVILPDPGPVRDGVSAPAAGAWLPGEHSEAPLSARGEYSPPVILSSPLD